MKQPRTVDADAALGRELKRKLRYNGAVRKAAHATVTACGDSLWTAQVGGRVKGAVWWFASADEAHERIDQYYNRLMMLWLRKVTQ